MATSSPAGLIKLLDLLVLVAAVPVFIFGDFPLLGLAVAGGVWLIQRLVQLVALRRVRTSATRSRAMGIIAASMLGRVWTVALAILIVGLTDRDAGLAAAVLSAALVTAYLLGEAVSRLSQRESQA
jgi:hypothetical protein